MTQLENISSNIDNISWVNTQIKNAYKEAGTDLTNLQTTNSLTNLKDTITQKTNIENAKSVLNNVKNLGFSQIYSVERSAGVVFALQLALQKLGYTFNKGIDGIYANRDTNGKIIPGSETYNNVLQFQKNRNNKYPDKKITEDGFAGSQTIKAILADLDFVLDEVVIKPTPKTENTPISPIVDTSTSTSQENNQIPSKVNETPNNEIEESIIKPTIDTSKLKTETAGPIITIEQPTKQNEIQEQNEIKNNETKLNEVTQSDEIVNIFKEYENNDIIIDGEKTSTRTKKHNFDTNPKGINMICTRDNQTFTIEFTADTNGARTLATKEITIDNKTYEVKTVKDPTTNKNHIELTSKQEEKLTPENTAQNPEIITETTKSFTSIQELETQYPGFTIQNPDQFIANQEYIIETTPLQSGNNTKLSIITIRKKYNEPIITITLKKVGAYEQEEAIILIPKNHAQQKQEQEKLKNEFSTEQQTLIDNISKANSTTDSPLLFLKTRKELQKKYPGFQIELNTICQNIQFTPEENIFIANYTETQKNTPTEIAIIKKINQNDMISKIGTYTNKYIRINSIQ